MSNDEIIPDASTATPGTGSAPVTPFQDFSEGRLTIYETITCQEEYRAFSLEEHRLADYSQGRAGSPANANRPFIISSNRSPRNDKKKLDLFRGKAIEIRVGMSNTSNEDTQTDMSNMWSLPKNLISHYSPFLQAACSWDFKETRNERIELPEDDPKLFGLFVEWMYYGSYDCSSLSPHDSTDAKCWVLGDKLLCNEFKNYALNRLYDQYMATPFSRAVPYNDVQYAWDNTAPGAKLREFYVDFVIQYFANPSKLLGTPIDWDALLQSHSDIRILLLQNFRHAPLERKQVMDVRQYLELDESRLNPRLEIRLAARGSSFGSEVEKGQSDNLFGTRDTFCADTEEVIPATGDGQEDTLEPLVQEEREDQ